MGTDSRVRGSNPEPTDPSGAMGDATVTITLMDVNEAPMFAATAPTTLYVTENTTELRTAEAAVPASPLGGYATDGRRWNCQIPPLTMWWAPTRTTSEYRSEQGLLTFIADHNPNFEIKPSYSISITATDSNTADDSHMALTSTLSVTVMVVDAEDSGDSELRAARAAG